MIGVDVEEAVVAGGRVACDRCPFCVGRCLRGALGVLAIRTDNVERTTHNAQRTTHNEE